MVDVEKEDITPVCPHCEKDLDKIVEVDRGFFSVARVYCCPHCRKVIGVSSGS